MIKKIFVLIIFFKLTFSFVHANQIGIYGWMVDSLKNPDRFFQIYQYEIENLNPSFFKKHLPRDWRELVKNDYDHILPHPFFKRFSISSSPTVLILSVFNYHFKAHVLEEAVYLPQISLGFGHHFYIPLYSRLFNDPVEKDFFGTIDFMSFSFDLIFSKSIRHNIKLFTGYRFSYAWLNLKMRSFVENFFNKDANSVFGVENHYDWYLNDIIFGMSWIIPYSDWENSVYLGFEPRLKKVFLKVEFSHHFIGIGLGLYPNNPLKLRPYIRLFYDFV